MHYFQIGCPDDLGCMDLMVMMRSSWELTFISTLFFRKLDLVETPLFLINHFPFESFFLSSEVGKG